VPSACRTWRLAWQAGVAPPACVDARVGGSENMCPAPMVYGVRG